MEAILRAVGLLARLNAGFAVLARLLCLSLVGVMTVAILLQVFFRYGLNDPLSWSEELAIYCMIWMAFLAGPVVWRTGAFVAIEMLRDRLPEGPRTALQVLLTVGALVVVATLLWFGLVHVRRGFGSTASSLPVRMAWVYAALPVGMAAMFLVGLELLLRDILALAGRAAELPPVEAPGSREPAA